MIKNFLYQKDNIFVSGISAQKIMVFIFLSFIVFCSFIKHASAATLVRPPNNLGLVGYWPMDEGTGLIVNDMSGNRLTGTTTVALAPTWTTGKRGKALNFDGASQRILLGTGTVGQKIHGATSVTMSAWINPSTYPSSGRVRVFTVVQNSITGAYIGLNSATGNLEVGGRSNTGDTFQNVVSSVIPQDKWTHVVGILNFSTDIITLYIDGVFISNNPASFVSNTYVHILGAGQTDNIGMGDNSEYFNGKIDDVRVYNRQLNAAQVAALYQSGQTTRKQVSNQGLVGYWSLNEGSGMIANDSSGNGNKGTLSGFALSGATSNWTTSGKKGGALTFDGVNDQVNLGTPEALNFDGKSAITVAGWANLSDANQSWPVIFAKQTASEGQYNLQFGQSTNRRPAFYLNMASGWQVRIIANAVLSADRWYHIATTYDGANVKIYIDGVLDNTVVLTGSIVGQSSDLVYIGQANTVLMKGKIDEIRVYDRALSASEIAALYRQNETRINSSQNNDLTEGLVGLWSFNGADYNNASTTAEVLDRSGQGNHGNAINGPVPTIGKVGQGLRFDGVDDYISLGSAGMSLTDFTVAAWFKANTTSGDITIGAGQWNGSSNTVYLRVTSNVLSGIVRSSLNVGKVVSNAFTDTRSFHHVVLTRVGDTIYGYLNGVPMTTTGITGANGSLTIGTFNGYKIGQLNTTGNYFNGIIDEYRIYNRALSAAEVKLLYNLGK